MSKSKKNKAEKKRNKIEKKIKRLNEKLRTLETDSDNSDSTTDSIPIIEDSIQEETIQEEIVETPMETEISLDNDTLMALGTVEEAPKGAVVHQEIGNRWEPILKKGFNKDEKSIIMKSHITYENIPVMPPKLNPEIAAAVSEPIKKRDTIIAARQKNIGVALTALGKSLQLFLEKGDKIEIIKNIHDASKILCDTIHSDTQSRRALISAVINKNMKDCLTEDADDFLFGSNLPDKIRTIKAVQKSIKDLKTPENSGPKPKPLNWRGPPRPNTRPVAGGKPTIPAKRKEDRKPKQRFKTNTQHRR